MPGEGRAKHKKQKQVKKYQDLARKLKKFWNTSETVVPIVVGALGAICNTEEELIKLNIDKKLPKMQFFALLGSVRILRKVLDFPGQLLPETLTNLIQLTIFSCGAHHR